MKNFKYKKRIELLEQKIQELDCIKKKKLFKQPNNLHRPKLQSFNPIFKITSTIDYKIFTKKLQ